MRRFSRHDCWKQIYSCSAARKEAAMWSATRVGPREQRVIWNGVTDWQQWNSPDCLSSILVWVMERTIMKDDTGLSPYLFGVYDRRTVPLKLSLSQSACKRVEHDHFLIFILWKWLWNRRGSTETAPAKVFSGHLNPENGRVLLSVTLTAEFNTQSWCSWEKVGVVMKTGSISK